MYSMQNKDSMQDLERNSVKSRISGSAQNPVQDMMQSPVQDIMQSPVQDIMQSPVCLSVGRCEKREKSGMRQESGMSQESVISQGSAMSQESRIGQELLLFIVKKVYGVDLAVEKNPVQREAGGKPYLVNHPDIHFNISHSDGAVICAVGRIPMGIDLQIHKTVCGGSLCRQRIEKTAKRILSKEEWDCFEKSGHAAECFYEYWTKKESYLKYTGEGIRRDLRELEYTGCKFWKVPFESGYSCTLCISEAWMGDIVIIN